VETRRNRVVDLRVEISGGLVLNTALIREFHCDTDVAQLIYQRHPNLQCSSVCRPLDSTFQPKRE
jgi:hypothetical protein